MRRPRFPWSTSQERSRLPRDAVATRDGHRVVLKVDGTTVQRGAPITEGLSTGTHRTDLPSGLQAGDAIVADARRDVAPGTRSIPFSRK